MAKDQFQDIVPASRGRRSVPVHVRAETQDDEMRDERGADAQPPERSIRNIAAPRRRIPERETPTVMQRRGRGKSRWLLWILALVSALFLGAILLVALRSTTVTITPRTHTVTFDQDSQFIALPAASGSGSLTYTVRNVELTDSEAVASTGTVRAEDRASGSVTVYNNYSAEPVRLLKNTRFESPGGLIFRAPAEIVVPGKRGTTAGKITVTVVADQAGENYNVAAGKFTVPGLKSSADMYANVYAQSSAPMTGGFLGDRPGVAQSDMDAAVATLRARLEKKARDAASPDSEGETVAYPDLLRITYEHMPNTTEAGGGVRVHERARIEIPEFPAPAFAQAVASRVAAEADNASIRLVPGKDFRVVSAATSTALGTDPLQFSLGGSALLIWNINEAELRQALAGKEKAAFTAIAKSFPGIEEAKARIEPFWSKTFPANPDDIRVKIVDPTE